jgi:YolD-like protein
MSILYRQNKLWEGSRMFLPEHREGILELQQKQKEYIQPELDEHQIEWINYIFQEALEGEKPIVVTYADKYHSEQFCGFVDRIDPYNQILHLSNGKHKKQISLSRLIHVDWP